MSMESNTLLTLSLSDPITMVVILSWVVLFSLESIWLVLRFGLSKKVAAKKLLWGFRAWAVFTIVNTVYWVMVNHILLIRYLNAIS